MTENPNLDPNFSKKKLLSLFQRADPCMLMDENEYEKRIAYEVSVSKMEYLGEHIQCVSVAENA